LPLAVIVKLWPEHPILAKSLSFWDSRGAAGGGNIVDGGTVSAEGAYTVAYPLAATAVRLGREDLAVRSLVELLLRRDRLAVGEHVWLRYHQQTEERSFRSWSRAFAWYMLGMTRAWLELKSSRYAGLPGMDEISDELCRVADIALRWRQPGSAGLWTCFLDQPDTGVETSGSAGIAAALALGARHGLLPKRHLDIAGECLHALEAFLAPDGILSGVSQHNAGGLELQTGGYRVLSQMGMGLMASLYSAIHAKPEGKVVIA
jgi:rhamnogalacturonyl hydrolase YesR